MAIYKQFCFFFILILLVGASGCSEKTPNAYTSKRGEYGLLYPKGWDMIDDDRKLTKLRDAANKSMGPQKFEFNPDVIFRGGDNLGGMVVMSPLAFLDNKFDSSLGGIEFFFNFFDKLEAAAGIKSKEVSIKEINGKKFRYTVLPAKGDVMTVALTTIHEKHIYQFQFSCLSNEFEKWRPEFDQLIKSISFKKEDVSVLQKTADDNRPGFFTGIWHGALVLFRFVASFFMNVEVYAHNNSGTGYMLGFATGVLFIIGGGARKS
ncbi:MAG: hypothetical protein H7834_06680 [Magnetococcus sp. YQC-9]